MRSPSNCLWKLGPLCSKLIQPISVTSQVRMGRKLKAASVQAIIGLSAEERRTSRPGHLSEKLSHPRFVHVVGIEAERDHDLFLSAKPTRWPNSFKSGICLAMTLATSLSLWLYLGGSGATSNGCTIR